MKVLIALLIFFFLLLLLFNFQRTGEFLRVFGEEKKWQVIARVEIENGKIVEINKLS